MGCCFVQADDAGSFLLAPLQQEYSPPVEKKGDARHRESNLQHPPIRDVIREAGGHYVAGGEEQLTPDAGYQTLLRSHHLQS